MSKRSLLFTLALVFLVPAMVFAKPKTKVFNNTPGEVFRAALKTAQARQVVTYVDEKNLMFTFETGRSALSGGFIANASVIPESTDKAKLLINVQQKEDSGFSFDAGGRMADKFFLQVQQELANASKQPVAARPAAPHVVVPPTFANVKTHVSDKGVVNVVSHPAGCDISVDGSFVGDAPAVLKLPPGKHTISISRSGYQTWSKELMVLGGSSVSLDATLTK